MLRRFLAGLAVVVVASVVAAYVFARHDRAVTILPGAAAAFGHGGTLPFGPFTGHFSPDGSKLLVLSADAASVATAGRLHQLNEEGDAVIDAAWMPGSNGVLMAFGPAGSDRMLVVDPAGTQLGTITLRPAVDIVAGGGMAVAPDGRTAIVTTRERAEGVGSTDRSSLTRVDLSTGATTPVVPAAPAELSHPVWLNAAQLVVDAGHLGSADVHASVLDISNGALRPVDAPRPNRAMAVLADGTIAIARRVGHGDVIEMVTPSGLRRAGSTPAASIAVDVESSGRLALAADEAAATTGAVRLRRVELQRATAAS